MPQTALTEVDIQFQSLEREMLKFRHDIIELVPDEEQVAQAEMVMTMSLTLIIVIIILSLVGIVLCKSQFTTITFFSEARFSRCYIFESYLSLFMSQCSLY